MKVILLDENLPAKLKRHFSDALEVFTVYDKSWQSKSDSELLEAISQSDIEALLTADRNLEFQQNIDKYDLQLVVLITVDNRYKTLLSKVEFIENSILNTPASTKVLHIDLRS